MAGSLNRATLIGNVGKDPEVRTMGNGGKVVSFSLATSESWRDKQSGERQERTEWHRVVVFNEGLGKIAEQYIKKGSKVMIEGAIQTRKWTDNQGVEKYTTEIVLQKYNGSILLLSGRQEDGGGRRDDDRGGDNDFGRSSSRGEQRSHQSLREELDDEIPF